MMRSRYGWKRSLPYPQLTEKARQRFDRILASLPDREADQTAPAPAVRGPRHLEEQPRRENPAPFVPVEGGHRSRVGRIAARAAFSLSLMLVIGLVLLNLSAPRVAESLPGVGSVFRVLNSQGDPPGPSDPDPTASPAQTEPFALSASQAECSAHFLFVTLTLTPREESFPGMDVLTGEWAGEEGLSLRVDGRRTELYSPVNLRREGDVFSGTAVLHLSQSCEAGSPILLTVSLEKLWGLEEGKSAAVTEDPLVWQGGLARSFTVIPQALLSPEELEGDGMFNGVAPFGVSEEPSLGQVSFDFSYPSQLGFVPMVSASRNGEYLPLVDYLEEDFLDDRHAVLYSFEAQPNEEPILLTVYSSFPGSHQFLGPGGFLCSQKLGTFLYDPASKQSFTVLSSFSAGDTVPLQELCALQRAALSCQNHFCPVMGPQFFYRSSEDLSLVEVGLASDLDADLSLELEVAVPGFEAFTLPLYRLTDSRQEAWPHLFSEETELGYNTVGDTVLVEVNSVAALLEQYPDQTPPQGYTRAYAVSIRLEGLPHEDGEGQLPALTLLWNGQRIPLVEPPSFEDFDAWERAVFPYTSQGGLDQVEVSPVPREIQAPQDPAEWEADVESEGIREQDTAGG